MYYGTVRLRGPYCTFLFVKRMVGLYVKLWKRCSGAIRFQALKRAVRLYVSFVIKVQWGYTF
jgi:hypothetical protein